MATRKTSCINEATKPRHRITRQTPLNMSLTQPICSKNTLQSLHNSTPTSMFGTLEVVAVLLERLSVIVPTVFLSEHACKDYQETLFEGSLNTCVDEEKNGAQLYGKIMNFN